MVGADRGYTHTFLTGLSLYTHPEAQLFLCLASSQG